MDYFKYLDFPNWEQVQTELKMYVNNNIHKFDPAEGSAILLVDPEDILINVPTIIDMLATKNLSLSKLFTAFFVVQEGNEQELHIDYSAKIARINIPVINCECSDTVFYASNKKYDPENWNFQDNSIPFVKLDMADYHEVSRYTLTKPVVIKVYEPHIVEMTTPKFPRIALTFMCNEDLHHLFD